MQNAEIDAALARLGQLRVSRAKLEAEETELLAALHAADRSGKEYLREEVAPILGWSHEMTRDRMREAVVLTTRFPATVAAMREGRFGWWHAHTLVDLTQHLPDKDARQIETKVLTRAASQTGSEFRRSVRLAVARIDIRGENERHQALAAERRFAVNPEEAGMASLFGYLPAFDAQLIEVAVQQEADLAPDDGRTMEQKRADALVALCTGTAETSGGSDDRPKVAQTILVTMAASTLLRLDDLPGELAGYGPIPAETAREIAENPNCTWRRLLTDPAGRLVDYGQTRYRPPAALRQHVITRDRTCRMPGCNRRAVFADIDHIEPYSEGGGTDEANLHCLCARHHALKHEAGWHIFRLPDGTTRWITPRGRIYEQPPEVLAEPVASVPVEHDDEPPPF